MRAEAGSQSALSELRTRIGAGDLQGARAAAGSLAPFWTAVGSQAGLLGTALQVAAGLDAAGTVAMLLEPFRVETVTPEHAGGLAAAAGQYGEEWTRGVIDGWFGSNHHLETDRYEWVQKLPGAMRGAACGRRTGSGAAAGRRHLGLDERPTAALDHGCMDGGVREPHLEMLGSPLARLLGAADDELRDEIVAALRGYGDNVH